MRNIVPLCFAVLTLALASVDASGQCLVRQRVVVQRQVAVVTPAVVVQRAVATAVIAVPVFVPAYSASYAGDSTSGIVAEIQALRREVASLRQPAPPQQPPPGYDPYQPVPRPATVPQQPQPQPMPRVPADEETALPAGPPQVFVTRCAACHAQGTAGTKGGGFVLLGAALTADQKLEVIRRVNLDKSDPAHMPRGGDLNDEEAAQVLDAMTRPTQVTRK